MIRDDAYNLHFSKKARERQTADNLDEAFEVTYGDELEGLSFWLVKPHSHIEDRFGLNKELLTIYCPYESPDARVKTAIEKIILDPEFKHRVDSSVFLLIHRGDTDSTSEIIRDPDWMIVPFKEEELADPQRGDLFIRARFSHFIGSEDLFGRSSPIETDEYFFGRHNLVHTLEVRNIQDRQNSGLFGLRKTGKTSVLRALERRLATEPVITAYFDCSNPGFHGLRWWEALGHIAQKLIEILSEMGEEIAGYDTEFTERNAGAQFTKLVNEILRGAQVEHIVFLLDEVEYITPSLTGALNSHWEDDFFGFWRSIRALHQETHGRLTFVVAGVNPVAVERSQLGSANNPIFQLALPQYLRPFTKGDVRSMVRFIGRRAGLNFDEKVYPYLQERFGGHPFLIRIACSVVWNSCDTTDPQKLVPVTLDGFHRLTNEIHDRLQEPIKDILLSLVWWYRDEYEILQMLAEEEHHEFASDYLEQSEESVLQFAKYGILKENTREFAIQDVKEFLKAQGDIYKEEVSRFADTDIKPEALPSVPDLDDLRELFEKKTELEIRLRRAIYMYLGVEYGWNNRQIAQEISKALRRMNHRSKKPENLFIGRDTKEVMNDLYLTELKDIVLENWNTFSSLFKNRSHFESHMESVNLARRVDSHSKPVTYHEAKEFNSSYDWLLNRLERIPNVDS